MRREEILQQLKSQRVKLTEFNVKHLAIFGSVARDEARADSDVDVLVEFEGPATFDQYMRLKIFLEDFLRLPVDLVTNKAVRPQLAPYIEREALRVA